MSELREAAARLLAAIDKHLDGWQCNDSEPHEAYCALRAALSAPDPAPIGTLTADAIESLVHNQCSDCTYAEGDATKYGRMIPCRGDGIHSKPYCPFIFMLRQAQDADAEKPDPAPVVEAAVAVDFTAIHQVITAAQYEIEAAGCYIFDPDDPQCDKECCTGIQNLCVEIAGFRKTSKRWDAFRAAVREYEGER